MKIQWLGMTTAVLTVSAASICAAGTITGKVDAKPAKFMENTVVYLDKVEGKTFTPPKDHVHMDQANLTFTPHVLAILAGTTVDFKNSDNVLHNVFSPDKCADQFNLGSWPQGETRSYTFKNAGCVSTVLCKVHPEMEAFVIVLQNPYFAVTKKDGSFSIGDVPAGKYTLKVWNEKLKGAPQDVTAGASDTTHVDVVLKH
jgi:plastocyanin